MSHGDVWGRVFWAEETAGAKAVRLEGCLVCSRSNQTCVARAELVCSLCLHKGYNSIVNEMCTLFWHSNVWHNSGLRMNCHEGKSDKHRQCQLRLLSCASGETGYVHREFACKTIK